VKKGKKGRPTGKAADVKISTADFPTLIVRKDVPGVRTVSEKIQCEWLTDCIIHAHTYTTSARHIHQPRCKSTDVQFSSPIRTLAKQRALLNNS